MLWNLCPWRYSNPFRESFGQPGATEPALSRDSDQVISKGAFQSHSLCDFAECHKDLLKMSVSALGFSCLWTLLHLVMDWKHQLDQLLCFLQRNEFLLVLWSVQSVWWEVAPLCVFYEACARPSGITNLHNDFCDAFWDGTRSFVSTNNELQNNHSGLGGTVWTQMLHVVSSPCTFVACHLSALSSFIFLHVCM